MALNPDCTVADIIPVAAASGEDGGDRWGWVCGCGAVAEGFVSKSKAKADHKEHRFPPLKGEPAHHALTPVPGSVGSQRPTQVLDGPFQIVFTSAPPDPLKETRRELGLG